MIHGVLSAADDWISRRLAGGLELLVAADHYASCTSSIEPVHFAVQRTALEERGLVECDFRWLAVQQLVEHFLEMTLPGDLERTFRIGGACFQSSSCFLLTDGGREFAETLLSESANPPSADPPVSPAVSPVAVSPSVGRREAPKQSGGPPRSALALSTDHPPTDGR